MLRECSEPAVITQIDTEANGERNRQENHQPGNPIRQRRTHRLVPFVGQRRLHRQREQHKQTTENGDLSLHGIYGIRLSSRVKIGWESRTPPASGPAGSCSPPPSPRPCPPRSARRATVYTPGLRHPATTAVPARTPGFLGAGYSGSFVQDFREVVKVSSWLTLIVYRTQAAQRPHSGRLHGRGRLAHVRRTPAAGPERR